MKKIKKIVLNANNSLNDLEMREIFGGASAPNNYFVLTCKSSRSIRCAVSLYNPTNPVRECMSKNLCMPDTPIPETEQQTSFDCYGYVETKTGNLSSTAYCYVTSSGNVEILD